MAFATSMPCRTREELVETLPETYRRRWIIETGFRVIKNVLGKTCSNALHVRLFLFHFALLLYNLWLLAKHADMRRGGYAGGEGFTIALFVQCLMSMDKKLLEWEKSTAITMMRDGAHSQVLVCLLCISGTSKMYIVYIMHVTGV